MPPWLEQHVGNKLQQKLGLMVHGSAFTLADIDSSAGQTGYLTERQSM